MVGVLQMAYTAISPVGWQFRYSIYLTYRPSLAGILTVVPFPHTACGWKSCLWSSLTLSHDRYGCDFVQETRVAHAIRMKKECDCPEWIWKTRSHSYNSIRKSPQWPKPSCSDSYCGGLQFKRLVSSLMFSVVETSFTKVCAWATPSLVSHKWC